MDFLTVIKLIAATLLPVVVSIGLYCAERKTRYGKFNYWTKQIIAGLLFACIAVLATQFGIPVEGAVLNVRNAAPLTAGLLFGGPAGIIAGVIGGVYRWFATYMGVGAFSQIACSIGCVLAGFFGAGCRKFMFDNKKASWFYGLAIGVTTEVTHMLLVFVTNMGDIEQAFKVVAICAPPMILCNGISVMLSLLSISILGKEKVHKPKQNRQISQVFQFLLLICVLVAFAATCLFTNALQTRIAYENTDNLLKLNLEDIKEDVQEALDESAQTGYDAQQFHEAFAEQIRLSVKNRHIGQSGGIIVCDDSLTIIADNGGHTGESVVAKSKAQNIAPETGVRFTAYIGGTESYCMYDIVEGFYLIATLPVSEAMFSRNIAICILMFMEVIVFAALFAHIYFLIKRLIVDNIHKINESLAQITDGDLDVHVNVRENEEFASLSDDINATVDTLKKYIAEAESRIDRELEFARQIQRSSLPSVFPPYPERSDFSIYASMDAAKEVGGDFYDFYLPDPSHLIFVVADVSGKGIPGALFMMRAKTLIRNLSESGMNIDEVFTEANRGLCKNNDAEMFVTAWIGQLDLNSGVLEYVNAGHNPPLVRHANGAFEYLRTKPNFILAGMDITTYKKHELQLSQGDEIFVYTDGVTEASNAENELYGEERLKNVLSVSPEDPKELCEAVQADIKHFVKEAEQSDDITMLCIKLNTLETRREISVKPDQDAIATVAGFLEETLESMGIPMKFANKAQIAVDEIFSNIVYYSGASNTTFKIAADHQKLTLVFEDNGVPYNPTTAKEPDITLSADEREIGGLGIYMVKKMAKELKYMYMDGKNIVTVVFSLE